MVSTRHSMKTLYIHGLIGRFVCSFDSRLIFWLNSDRKYDKSHVSEGFASAISVRV
jgi:hypothetical protein